MVSYKPSMFIWINRSLGLPFMEQVAVRKVGESDMFKLFGLLWWFVSYYTLMMWEREVRFCHYFSSTHIENNYFSK